MRKAIAAFLLACIGAMLPMAAAPVRLCLLKERLLVAETSRDKNCCDDCGRETNIPEPCCVDLEALPDSVAPQPVIGPPPVAIRWLPAALLPPAAVECSGLEDESRSAPTRGPTSPAAYRAVLAIWRL